MAIKFVIDFDDTLVNSTFLNNDAYNYALEKHGFNRINSTRRITRKSIRGKNKEGIIKLKQKYFTRSWMKYRVIINTMLLEKIQKMGKRNCILWSAADPQRRNLLLKSCNLKKYFSRVIYDAKEDPVFSLSILKKICNKKPFLIYENNPDYLAGENVVEYVSITNPYFKVKGYLCFPF